MPQSASCSARKDSAAAKMCIRDRCYTQPNAQVTAMATQGGYTWSYVDEDGNGCLSLIHISRIKMSMRINASPMIRSTIPPKTEKCNVPYGISS